MKQPLVSIVITNYNYGKFVAEAIDSALKQSYPNIEIIVIDDASTDNSLEIIQKFKDKISVIEHSKNLGIVKTRNQAIKTVSGDYLLFLDSDDTIPKDYISSLVRVAQAEGADVVYSGTKQFPRLEIYPAEKYHEGILYDHNIANVSSLISKKSIGNIRYDAHPANIYEDWCFYVDIMSDGAKFASSKTFLNYRVGHTSRSRPSDDEWLGKRNHAAAYLYIINKHKKATMNLHARGLAGDVIELYRQRQELIDWNRRQEQCIERQRIELNKMKTYIQKIERVTGISLFKKIYNIIMRDKLGK